MDSSGARYNERQGIYLYRFLLDTLLKLLSYPLEHHWADVVSIIGFPLAIWGIVLAINDARKAKSAAEMAQAEVRKLRQTLLRLDSVANLADAVAIMDEIKRSHRNDLWDNLLLDRYSALRRKLIAVKISNVDIHKDYAPAIQNAIVQFRRIESQVELSLKGTVDRLTTAKLNAIISMETDKIDAVLNAMKQDIGE